MAETGRYVRATALHGQDPTGTSTGPACGSTRYSLLADAFIVCSTVCAVESERLAMRRRQRVWVLPHRVVRNHLRGSAMQACTHVEPLLYAQKDLTDGRACAPAYKSEVDCVSMSSKAVLIHSRGRTHHLRPRWKDTPRLTPGSRGCQAAGTCQKAAGAQELVVLHCSACKPRRAN
jgi:hypothetical protein